MQPCGAGIGSSLELSSVDLGEKEYVGSRPRRSRWNRLEPDSRWMVQSRAHRVAGCALGFVALMVMAFAVATGHLRSAQNTCLGGAWPEFHTHAQLEAHEAWARYFRSVYGALPQREGSYPLCVGDAWLLYTAGLEAAGVPLTSLPATATCPRDNGALALHTGILARMYARTLARNSPPIRASPPVSWPCTVMHACAHAYVQAAWRGSATMRTRRSRRPT